MLWRSVLLDVWSLAKPVLAVSGLLLFARLAFIRNTAGNWWMIAGALLLTLIGLYLFLAGVSSSLLPLSEETGRGLVLVRYKLPVILFIALIAYCSTLMEPGLKMIAGQIETVSIGAIRGPLITQVAAVGFALGAGLGTVRVFAPFSMKWAALIAMLVLSLLVLLAPEHMVGIAFDCASATTGPVNIPILVSLAIGLSQAVSGADPVQQGFGLVAFTAYGTTASILVCGIIGEYT
jgi:hypothetical protein